MRNENMEVKTYVSDKLGSQMLISDTLADIVTNRIDKMPDIIKRDAYDEIINSIKKEIL